MNISEQGIVTLSGPDKDRPDQAWIDALRRRYPVDPEVDRVLTRKMQLRAGPGYQPVSLERLCDGMRSLLSVELDQPFELSNVRWLAGGASKLQMAFELSWDQPGIGPSRTPMVVRMEPAASVVETSRLQEFELVRAVGSVLPAPPCYWVDPNAEHFPYPAMVYGFAEGVTKPSGTGSNVSGFGTGFPPKVREALSVQFVDHLAALHTWDWQNAGMASFDVPNSGRQAVERVLNKWARVWEEDVNEDIPLFRYATSWLRENIPPLDRPSMIHGDYRTGNFLYTEKDNRITAWLDWELGHPGDPHEDLALITLGALGNLAEDGKTFLVSNLMSEDALFEHYEASSGISVNLKTLKYYRVFSAWRAVANCVGTGYRVAHNSKTHQDIVVQWLMALSYSLLGDLHDILKKEV
jgi:aminoglycoside phosphotransferase (APT) family kinase protein